MKNRYILYLGGMGLLAALLLLSGNMGALRLGLSGLLEGSVSVQPEVVMLFALLAHGPAFLTVAQQNALLGKPAGKIGRYPEGIIPLLVLASWTLAGGAGGTPVMALVVGVAAAAALGVCYGAVRVVVAVSAKTANASSHVPGFSAAPLKTAGTKGIYGMRLVMAAASLCALIAFLSTGAGAVWLLFVAVLVGSAAGVLAGLSITSERAVTRRAAKTATQALATRLRSDPAEVALYYSGPAASKHTAPVKLAGQLAKEGLSAVIIAREAGARKALAKAPHRHLWVSPTIDTLDAMAQPGLRVIFYINDAAKNGHFIRFNDFAHVMQATGSIATVPSLPRNCAMYDMIIAPDLARAGLWRAAADPDLARRIVTLGALGALGTGYKRAQSYPPACPVLTLHLGAAPVEAADAPPDLSPFLEMLPRLIAAVNTRALARLEIWFPAPAQGTSDPMLRLLHRDVEMAIEAGLEYDDEGIALTPLVSMHTGTPQAAANAADFPVLTAQSDLAALRGTEKPLLWFDPAPTPEGVPRLGDSAQSYAAALHALWSAPAVPAEPAEQTSGQDRHFASYAALIEAVTAQKQARSEGGSA